MISVLWIQLLKLTLGLIGNKSSEKIFTSGFSLLFLSSGLKSILTREFLDVDYISSILHHHFILHCANLRELKYVFDILKVSDQPWTANFFDVLELPNTFQSETRFLAKRPGIYVRIILLWTLWVPVSLFKGLDGLVIVWRIRQYCMAFLIAAGIRTSIKICVRWLVGSRWRRYRALSFGSGHTSSGEL